MTDSTSVKLTLPAEGVQRLTRSMSSTMDLTILVRQKLKDVGIGFTGRNQERVEELLTAIDKEQRNMLTILGLDCDVARKLGARPSED